MKKTNESWLVAWLASGIIALAILAIVLIDNFHGAKRPPLPASEEVFLWKSAFIAFVAALAAWVYRAQKKKIPPTPQNNNCPNCGQSVHPSVTDCPSCGANLY